MWILFEFTLGKGTTAYWTLNRILFI